jgi:uncharacterized Fe-S cluster-containing radical SAM superfamily protein
MRNYSTHTIKAQVGCGELRVSLSYKPDNRFHFALLSLDSQDSDCGCCWLYISANFITALIRRIKPDEIPEVIIKNTKNQRCQKHGLNSCPNALGHILEKELEYNASQEKK